MNLDEERFVPKQVTWFIAGAQGRGPARRRDVEVRDEQTRKMVEVYQAYEDQCQREGVVDFAELMLRTYELLRDNDAAARALPAALPPHPGRRVPGHQRPAVRLAEDVRAGRGDAGGRRVFAVGDDDQSIYAFRGAQVGNMADFEREFRVRARDQAGAELPLASATSSTPPTR